MAMTSLRCGLQVFCLFPCWDACSHIRSGYSAPFCLQRHRLQTSQRRPLPEMRDNSTWSKPIQVNSLERDSCSLLGFEQPARMPVKNILHPGSFGMPHRCFLLDRNTLTLDQSVDPDKTSSPAHSRNPPRPSTLDRSLILQRAILRATGSRVISDSSFLPGC